MSKNTATTEGATMRTIHTIEEAVNARSLHAPNYRVAQNCLAQLHPFHHSTMSGKWTQIDGEHVYVVLSYRTEVAWVTEKATAISPNHWGVTTGKHLNYAKAYLPAYGWEALVNA